MDGPAELTLVTSLSTTADVRALDYPRWLASSLRELFGVDDLLVTWVPEGAGAARRRRWSELDADTLASIYGLGVIALSDPVEEQFDAGIEWRLLRRGGGRGAREPLEQNAVNLRLGVERVADEAFREAYLRWCARAAQHVEATYGIAHNEYVHHVRMPHVEGLGAGLRDVHWLNVFGPEFCDLIGVERLLSAPAARTERLGPRHVLVLADDAVLEPPPHGDAREPWPPTRALVDPIIDHIGREFFVTPRPPDGGPQVSGLLRGLRQLRGKGSGFDDPDVMAARRPRFDYSAMLGDD